MEIWKDIILDSNEIPMYQVSNMGRVRSKNRIIYYEGNIHGDNSLNYIRKRDFKGKILVQNFKENYLRVALRINQKDIGAKTYLVHRLVADAFIENIDNKPVVDHIDNNTKNTHVSNLRWFTYSENRKNSLSYNTSKTRVNIIPKFNHEEKWVNLSLYDSQFNELGDSLQISSWGVVRYKSKIRNFKQYSYTYPKKDKWCNYPIITLNFKGFKKYKRRVHNVLATLFVPNPNNKMCVNHKDGNPLNFDINNLEWVTFSENNKHAYDEGVKPRMVGNLNGNCNHTEKQIRQSVDLFKTGTSVREISKITGVSRNTIKNVLRGKSWSNLNLGNYTEELKSRGNDKSNNGKIMYVTQELYDNVIQLKNNKILLKDISTKLDISPTRLRNLLKDPKKYVR